MRKNCTMVPNIADKTLLMVNKQGLMARRRAAIVAAGWSVALADGSELVVGAGGHAGHTAETAVERGL